MRTAEDRGQKSEDRSQKTEESIENITALVRGYASVNCRVRPTLAAQALGLTRLQAESSFKTLMEQGFLKRIGKGIYEYVERPMAGQNSPVNDRLWRAMLIHPSFSCSEIARVAGTTTNYVYKVLRKYIADGMAEPDGRQKALSGFAEKKWRLTQLGKTHKERPLLKTFEPDPLVVKTVTLNRLVCTGVALRMADERAKAVRMCEEIMEILAAAGRLENHNQPEGESHDTAIENHDLHEL